MADKDEEIRELIPTLEEIYQIECVACGATDITPTTATTEPEAAKWFHDGGWRIADNEARCPECMELPEPSERN